MNIHMDSKKIIKYFLERAIELGDLKAQFFIGYDQLATTLGLESEAYCRVCCQYLSQTRCISISRAEQGNPAKCFSLEAKGIDFLEST